MSSWKKSFAVNVFCFVLVAVLLAAAPILAFAQGGGQAAGTGTGTGTGITPDPLKRLPAGPQEARQRLQEKDIAWPAVAAGAAYQGVKSGVQVALPFDTVTGFITHPGADVRIELWNGAVFKQSVTRTSDAEGWFKADLSAGDIVSGDTVIVLDLAGGAPAVIDCSLTGNVDFSGNRVTGATVASNLVDVYIVTPSTYYADVPPGAAHGSVTVGAGGAYAVNFTGLDLRQGDAAMVFSTNAGGHQVMDTAAGSGLGLVVYPQYNDVMGYYVPGTDLTVFAGAASRELTTQGDGFFEAWFTDRDVFPGQAVSCDMGGEHSIIVRDVTAQCDPSANTISGTAPVSKQLRVTMDPYGSPATFETTSNASGAFSVALGALSPATGTDVYNIAWYDDDGDCVVYEFQTFSWYLAEGYTGGDFDTWVMVQNPGPDDAMVVMSFQLVTGTAPDLIFTLPAGTRSSVYLDSLPGLADAQVSTQVTSISGNWIVAERAVYFNYGGKVGGHDSIGALSPSTAWYLAEGYTGGDFDTWVLVQNPGAVAAEVTLSFQLVYGSAADFNFTLPAGMRQSIHLDEVPGLADAQVSTKVSSNQPVVAERAMYFNYFGKTGGSDSIGVIAPSTEWYLAEGYTGDDFDTWMMVQNAGTEAADVTLSFQLTEGTAPDYTFNLAAGTRQSIYLDSLPGLSAAQVSTKVSADVPVVAERAMYFNYYGKIDGHVSIGASKPEKVWYLAEGYTGGEFDTWVLVQNPGTAKARVTLSFQLTEGTAEDFTFDLPGGMRQTIWVDTLPGLADAQVSTKVSSSQPVVAERAMYFNYFGKKGGHASIGVPEVFK
jgi:hypothetical protein